MITPVNSLANMEMLLYGGYGMNSSAPSYVNGYMSNSQLNTMNGMYPSFYGQYPTNGVNPSAYGQYSTNGAYPSSYGQYSYPTANFGQQIPQNYNYQTQPQGDTTTFSGLTKRDLDALSEEYRKSLSPSESLTSAVVGGAGFGTLMMNPGIMAHPINFIKATFGIGKGAGATKEMFKDLVKSDLWKQNHYALEKAFAQMHKAESRSFRQFGIFQSKYTPEQFNKLKDAMEKALTNFKNGGSIDEVIEATEKLKLAQVNNGALPRAWNWCVNKFRKHIGKSEKIIRDPAEIAKYTHLPKSAKEGIKLTQGLNAAKPSWSKAFQKAGGKIGIVFGALEILMNLGKIQTAFEKDSKTGCKQLAQTTVKAFGNAAGWVAGETIGVWAAAKAGAAIGTAFGPGVGTAIGAVAGLIGGSIGMWLAGKTTKALMGEDVADKIESEKLTQTEDGQVQLLQNTMQRMQDGEKVDPVAQQALMKVLQQQQQQQQLYA